MKHIVKGAVPACLTQWMAQANEDWQPTYENLQNPQKHDLHEALLAEQGRVCCYCGRRVSRESSHIEHFKPQQSFPELSLEYSNLFASCLRQVASTDVLHCGHAKGENFNERLSISPKSEGCESRFLHTLDGRELPADRADDSANYMIQVLNQNAAFLTHRRAEALRGIFDEVFIASATNDELTALINKYGPLDETGSFRDFAHVVVGYAQRLRR